MGRDDGGVTPMATTRPDANLGFTIAALAAAVAAMALPFRIAATPIEPVMGPIQKIFYFHVPSCWMLLLSTLTAGIASLWVLFKNSDRADRVALAAGEIGVLFGTCGLVTGPLWGKVAWGKYWTWDARQTSTLLLFLVLLAYLIARTYGGPGAKKLAAALALFATANVPLVYLSPTLWRTLHPDARVVPTLASALRPALYLSALFFLWLWLILLTLRLRLATLHAAIEDLQRGLDEA
jgi:heme exporter protein C